ncbi:MAG TPA: glycosyltransferase family 4 protein [Solirubrobacteraceae bacterium]
MRILIFHGYLLGGTGSNVYNARLAPALVALGHEVHLFSQDRHAQDHEFVDAVGDWDAGALRVRVLPPARSERGGPPSDPAGSRPDSEPPRPDFDSDRPVRCTVYRPNIGSLLPVYVMDRYEGMQARTFPQCDERQVENYIGANVAAVREVTERVQPHLALANHLVMGPAILARALAGTGVPYVVKVHGSALEYTVKAHPERFLGYAREGVAGAVAILVGSRHTAESLWQALGDPQLPARTRLGPPGVDVARFRPRGERGQAGDPLVAFVGKLIVNKGVDLLLAAWPLVLDREPRARLLLVGFGTDRGAFERLLERLAGGELEQAGDGARRHLSAFLGSLHGAERERYVRAARALRERAILTGRLEHEELADVLPACEALIVPSTFPEAFGMVAAEGAACGALPISAAHSGLAEVSGVLARHVPPEAAAWLSFPVDDQAVRALAERIVGWLGADPDLRARTRAGIVAAVREHWSWEGVARGLIAAASGELDARPFG